MAEKNSKRFPTNGPYVAESREEISSPRASKNIKSLETISNSPSAMSASVLAERVQYLEEQLVNLSASLNDEGRDSQEWKDELTIENARLYNELERR